MKIYSKAVDSNFDVDVFVRYQDKKTLKLGICYESLEDILINQMPANLETTYSMDSITAGPDYCAVKCEISDIAGRHVVGFGDVSIDHTNFKDASSKQFAMEHPLTQAMQTAVTSAVNRYLDLPRVLTRDTLLEILVDKDDIGIFDDPSKKTETHDTPKTPDIQNTDLDMLLPFDQDILTPISMDDSTLDDIAKIVAPEDDGSNNNADEPKLSNEDVGDISDIEPDHITQTNEANKYDNVIVSSGKYSGKKCIDLYNSNDKDILNWFGYIRRYENSPKWKDVAAFAASKGIEKN